MGHTGNKLSTTLFATLITSVCYGIAITLFIKSVGTIVRRKRIAGQLNLLFAIASALVFILATVNVIGLWVNIHVAFVLHPNDSEAYLSLIRTPAKSVYQTGQVGAILLADALMVYRAFMIWRYDMYVIVLPCMTFAATFVSGVAFIRLQHTIDLETSIFSKAVTEWTVAFLLCSLATTLYSTGLIAYKLLKAQRQLHQHGVLTTDHDSLSRRIMRIITESAALYSLNHLLYAVLYEAKTNVESTPSYLEASIASITCSLIIIRTQKAINRPLTLSSCIRVSGDSSVVPAEPLAKGKYPKSHDRMIFALRSMEVDMGTSRTADPERCDSEAQV